MAAVCFENVLFLHANLKKIKATFQWINLRFKYRRFCHYFNKKILKQILFNEFLFTQNIGVSWSFF